DSGILKALGERLAQRRIDAGMTQAMLARHAGVSKRTLERIENGASTQTATLVKLMRVLGLLDALDAAVPKQMLRPIALLNTGRPRKRVRETVKASPNKPWSWNDDE
ncbi:MAG: helix-turn-helix domain-containing protein, partial [Deltaproteobacteria bacterium]|nr:helix-turn-helix domain-containing protein [Deltaproteobacteria bacterium]